MAVFSDYGRRFTSTAMPQPPATTTNWSDVADTTMGLYWLGSSGEIYPLAGFDNKTVNRNRRPEWLVADAFLRPPVRRPLNVVRFEHRQKIVRKLRRRNRRRKR